MTSAEEQALRFKVRQEYREEGNLHVWKRYSSGTQERLVALSESHKIRFEDEFNNEPE